MTNTVNCFVYLAEAILRLVIAPTQEKAQNKLNSHIGHKNHEFINKIRLIFECSTSNMNEPFYPHDKDLHIYTNNDFDDLPFDAILKGDIKNLTISDQHDLDQQILDFAEVDRVEIIP